MDDINDLFTIYRLSFDKLNKLSFESKLSLSIKNDLKYFDKNKLINELISVVEFYNECDIFDTIDAEYRIKSVDSIMLKYDRYFPNHQVRKVFNDLLGFRILSSDYQKYLSINCSNIKVVDMTNGKSCDDGYRGVHLYYQKDSRCYPIEIQINTYIDRQFNDWLHKYIYKRGIDNNIGRELRKKYENGMILDENKFKEELKCVI